MSRIATGSTVNFRKGENEQPSCETPRISGNFDGSSQLYPQVRLPLLLALQCGRVHRSDARGAQLLDHARLVVNAHDRRCSGLADWAMAVLDRLSGIGEIDSMSSPAEQRVLTPERFFDAI